MIRVGSLDRHGMESMLVHAWLQMQGWQPDDGEKTPGGRWAVGACAVGGEGARDGEEGDWHGWREEWHGRHAADGG